MITASTGNHGQSIAFACKIFGARAIIGLPLGANPLKVESMRDLGAELIFHGKNLDEAKAYSEKLADEKGYRFIHPANDPLLIAGAATVTLEIIEELPQVDTIFVPMGGGSAAAGACLVAKAINPEIQVIAVQAASAQAGYLSWNSGHITRSPIETVAEGLATGSGYELPQSILRELLDDFILVSDDEMLQAIAILIDKAHTLSEAAGAAALAGAMKHRDRINGKNVAIVVSGGNITLPQLKEVLAKYHPE